jgi:hypothetical protein
MISPSARAIVASRHITINARKLAAMLRKNGCGSITLAGTARRAVRGVFIC